MMNESRVTIFDAFTTTHSNNVFELMHNEEYMSDIAYLLAAMTLFFIGFFGFFLNLFVIVLMFKDMQVGGESI